VLITCAADSVQEARHGDRERNHAACRQCADGLGH
jgi:hypothetical protein